MRDIKDIREIVEGCMELTLDSLKFVELEILFRLAERIGMLEETDKLYTILSRGDVIYESDFSNDNFLIANAKMILKTISHAKVYHDTAKEYQLPGNQCYAMYITERNCVVRNPHVPIVYESRIVDYDALLEGRVTRTKARKKRGNEKDIYLVRTNSGNDVRMRLEPLKAKNMPYGNKLRRGGAIEITMEEIMIALMPTSDLSCQSQM